MTSSSNPLSTDVAIIGAGNVGIAVAYFLVVEHGLRDVVLIDPRDPMSLTSAQSGENYRNWWPHPVMTAFTDHSIALMEQLDRDSGGRLAMTRGGYALVTRRERPDDLLEQLERGYRDAPGRVRLRDTAAACASYAPPQRAPWGAAPDGVDVLLNAALIRRTFPSLAADVRAVLHIRRAGSISAQQMGQFMLERIRAAGGRLVRAEVTAIAPGASAALTPGAPFELTLHAGEGAGEGTAARTLRAQRIVNAAGPFLRDIGAMLGEDLRVTCVYQQKIAFEDRERAVPRDLPFTIDLDGQTLAWSDEDRELLASDPATRKLVEPMPGGIHCRPDGPADGRWIKLGWAYNATASDPHAEPEPIDPQFPDSVLRAASRLHPGIGAYIGRLPRGARHYGGYYTMTDENWPLIGPLRTPGAFVAGALSGFGSMAACASGQLCAAWVAGRPVPAFAQSLSPRRVDDRALMDALRAYGQGSL